MIDHGALAGEVTAYLGLGASLGDRQANIADAISRLQAGDSVRVVAVSPLYESAHIGLRPGDAERFPRHLNGVIRIVTRLSPWELLRRIQDVETAGGRVRQERWGPRTIDIDILVYDSVEMNTDELVLPHPRLAERAFVVLPLRDLDPEMVLSGGRRVSDLAAAPTILSQDIRQVPDHAVFL
jgi:2-amino-4-hydroxy-6-hydroxymethyldihydropteridine diphosphokinase